MTKNWERHARHWPQRGDIDCDYATGREFTGEFKPMPSREESTKFNRPIPGGPQFMVNQWDKALQEDKANRISNA